jgi:hypothetical protein
MIPYIQLGGYMAMTKHQRWLARRVTLRKYRISEKNKENQRRYNKCHREERNKSKLTWVCKNRDRVNILRKLRNSTPEGKALRKASCLKYALKNRIKRLAKDAVHNAIRAGKIVRQPCSICGILKSEGHHPNYAKSLEVVWLCKKHHAEIHRKTM